MSCPVLSHVSCVYMHMSHIFAGFGDMVALQKDNALNSRPEYVVFALVFILFGLAIVAASLNLLVSRHLSVMSITIQVF